MVHLKRLYCPGISKTEFSVFNCSKLKSQGDVHEAIRGIPGSDLLRVATVLEIREIRESEKG